MYKDIADELKHRGYTVTAFGCRRKYNKLLDRYKKVKDNNAMSGKLSFMSRCSSLLKQVCLLFA